MSILLWSLGITSIFSFYILYSPNPFRNINIPSKHPSTNDHQHQSLFLNPKSPLRVITPKQDLHGYKECDLFTGRWVHDPKGPLYTNWSCPTIPDSKNCRKHGREDVGYVHWRWKPDKCELPRFLPKTFFRIVQGKTMVFIGDSVARNHMESLLCLLSQEETPIDKYTDKEDRERTWFFPSYNFTLKVLWSKFLVNGDERVINGSSSGVFDLYLDKVEEKWAEKLNGLDYIIFSAGHWFYRPLNLYEEGKLIGCVYCDNPNVTHKDPDFALQRVFNASLKYINRCENCNSKLLTIVRTFTPAHFENGQWDTGGNCNRTSPYNNETPEREINLDNSEWKFRSAQLEAVERAKNEGEKRGKRFGSLDVTKAMFMRPDGHPDTHWDNRWMKGYSDCVHWCMPGPIDVWSDLLLAAMIKAGDF
ncbi:hypothetical protein GIB67_004260 [Kingdonia uniflora]|uniref:Trichome birefringence-like N-terminal domain-containing protein n=1 Tax=Kingdonia uniflora TaxID=39325 RepID=A0A7J7MRC2_9MAGN|nr:hypothetical protein GIB67_004260 [Kingdonia uniflora]